MLISIALLALFGLPQTPDPTLPPPNAQVKATAVGLGVQVYQCSPQGGGFAWVFEEPQATLFDPKTHQPVGTHGAGPTWTWSDGSSVTGKVLQKRDSEVAGSVPWLLVEVHSTGAANGQLALVSLVRRSETQAGGAPTTGCDATHQNTVIRVPYQATYTFYTTSN